MADSKKLFELFAEGADPLQGNQEFFPDWSWDHVRTWVAIRRGDKYSNDQIRELAGHDVVMLEKMNGHQTCGSIERGALEAAKSIKQINPKVVILFYLNSMVHYGSYSANEDWNPDWAARNRRNGELITWTAGKRPSYDHTNKDFREWWIKRGLDAVSSDEIDGLFIDAIVKTSVGYLPKGHAAAYLKTANELRDRLPKGKLLIGNALRANRGGDGNFSHLKYLDGSYLEGWATNKDHMVKTLELMDAASKNGRIIMLTGFPFHLDNAKFNSMKSLDERYKYLSRPEHISFPLAFLLLVVRPYAYFTYRSDVDANPKKLAVFDSNRFEAITRELGEPLGDYERLETYVFTREFEHVKVRVNLEKNIGKITVKYDREVDEKDGTDSGKSSEDAAKDKTVHEEL